MRRDSSPIQIGHAACSVAQKLHAVLSVLRYAVHDDVLDVNQAKITCVASKQTIIFSIKFHLPQNTLTSSDNRKTFLINVRIEMFIVFFHVKHDVFSQKPSRSCLEHLRRNSISNNRWFLIWSSNQWHQILAAKKVGRKFKIPNNCSAIKIWRCLRRRKNKQNLS